MLEKIGVGLEVDQSLRLELNERVADFKKSLFEKKISEETIIKSEPEASRFKRRYLFTDESASKTRMIGGNKKGELYELIGATSESVGIDLSEGKSVKEIIELLEKI